MGFPNPATTQNAPATVKAFFAPPPKKIGDIDIDVLYSENPDYSWELTEHAVEEGADISDHRIKKPVTLSLECGFLDPALNLAAAISAIATAASGGGFDFSNRQEKWDALLELADKQEPITVITPAATYLSMMIVGIRPEFRNTTEIRFTIDLKHIRIVASEVSAIDPSDVPPDIELKEKHKAASKTKKKKTQKAKKPTKPASADKKSILKKLLG